MSCKRDERIKIPFNLSSEHLFQCTNSTKCASQFGYLFLSLFNVVRMHRLMAGGRAGCTDCTPIWKRIDAPTHTRGNETRAALRRRRRRCYIRSRAHSFGERAWRGSPLLSRRCRRRVASAPSSGQRNPSPLRVVDSSGWPQPPFPLDAMQQWFPRREMHLFFLLY